MSAGPGAGSATGAGVAADVTAALLRELPLFADLSAELLDATAAAALRLTVPTGEWVIHEGAEDDGFYVLVDGELEVTRRVGTGEIALAVLGAGAFLGEMSLIEQGPRTASVRALRDSELLVLDAASFRRIVESSPGFSIRLTRAVTARLRGTEAQLVQHATLASLGTLAAGLAHELNNPAAALQRGLAQMAQTLGELDDAAALLGEERAAAALRLAADRLRADRTAAPVATLQAIDAEDAVTAWLAGQDVARPAVQAPRLAAAGWTPAELTSLLAETGARERAAVVAWLAARSDTGTLLAELTHAAAAVVEIVAAVRAHTALGRPELAPQDVVDGIESALVLLRPRITPGIEVVRRYAPDRPHLEAYGRELNHVWLNLIDNALRAMGEQGTLELQVEKHGDRLVVEVVDSGPGVPPEIQARVFDPFFTTRAAGDGSGLGLHIAYTAVARHRGSIRLASRPGRTVFSVELPLRQPGA